MAKRKITEEQRLKRNAAQRRYRARKKLEKSLADMVRVSTTVYSPEKLKVDFFDDMVHLVMNAQRAGLDNKYMADTFAGMVYQLENPMDVAV